MKTKMMTMDNISTIELPNYFKQGKVFIFQNNDFLMIKKSPVIDFSYVRNKLKKIGKNISQQDINQAVLSARRG